MESALLLLFRLLALLAAARVAAEIAERLRLPAVLVEISAGVLLGPSLLGFVGHDESLHFLGELGAIFLLMEVGMHMDLADLTRVGRSALLVAVVGIAAPMGGGFIAMRAMGVDPTVALFLAAGITATSVGITARVFADMRALASAEAQTVLGAAVADDVIGLLILTVVARLSSSGGIDLASIAAIAVIGVGFVVVATVFGAWLAPLVFDRLVTRARTEGTLIGAAVVFTLAFAGLAGAAKLAPIVGAFVAGLSLARIEDADDLQRRLAPLTHLFVPVFFLLIGAEARASALADPRSLAIVGVLVVVAIVGKVASGIGVKRGTADRLLIGIGMIPRGEVGVVFATLGLASGVLGVRDHAVLLTVVLLTTVAAPPWLRRRIERGRRSAMERAVGEEPDGGWLAVSPDEVELAAEPPAGLVPLVGLEAALLCATRRPGRHLLDWLSSAQPQSPTWGAELRRTFLALLREGNARSWRLLDVTGLLQVLMPEIEQAMRRRKQDPFDLDPLSALRWDEVEAVNDLTRRVDDAASKLWTNVAQDAVLVAALARSAFRGHGHKAEDAARQLATTLGLTDDGIDLVVFLVAERGLLPAAASRLSMGREETILELAAHIGTQPRASALYLLAAAAESEPTRREALDELHRLISATLAHPELTAPDAGGLAEARREAVKALPSSHEPDVRALLDAAPRRYLLTHPPHTIARHARMLETPITRGEVRIQAEPDLDHGAWTVHIVTSDRPGALAAITRAFAACDIPIVEAWISTWANGAIVDVFRVKASRDVDWERVRDAAAAALAGAHTNGASPAIEGRIDVDNVASPWHTIVEVRAHDRTGLLHKVAAAFARAGLQIHHATVRTIDEDAVDTFLVTDRNGHKLDARGEKTLQLAFEGRTAKRWTSRRLSRLSARTSVS